MRITVQRGDSKQQQQQTTPLHSSRHGTNRRHRHDVGHIRVVIFDKRGCITACLENNVNVAGNQLRNVVGLFSLHNKVVVFIVAEIQRKRLARSSPATQVRQRIRLSDLIRLPKVWVLVIIYVEVVHNDLLYHPF